MSGHLSQLHRMVAFSVDIRSDGRPSLFHEAIWASSVNIVSGSIPGVHGMGTCKLHTLMSVQHSASPDLTIS